MALFITPPPRFVIAAVIQQHVRQAKQKVARFDVVVVFQGARHGLRHQLQGADAVALDGADHLAAAAPVAPVELAGHDEAAVIDVHVVLGSPPQQPPVILVELDDVFQ